MLGALTSLVATEDWETMERLGQPLRTGPTLPRLVPFGMYPCRDGYVSIVAPQDPMAHELFRAMGRPELIEDPGFGTRDGRIENPWPVEQAIEAWTSEHTVAEVVDILRAVRIGVAPVRTQIEALNDPRVVGRGETRPVIHPDLGEIPGIRASGIPITFSEPTSDFSFPAQHLGEDNDIVYRGFLGYSDERIEALRRTGTI
jgi:crotonobetainyl-CoA:carnitine CoA-transferase CaiB-like acyl-CoA transferase